MKTLAPFLLLLAACRSTLPPAETASVTFYGDVPRLETWEAHVADGIHVHASNPGPGCVVEILDRLVLEAFPDGKPSVEKLCRFWGTAHGGPRRLVLLLVSPGEEPAEALAVDVPRLAPEETERTFTRPDVAVVLERPAGTRVASIERGRVTVRRVAAGRYDIEVFAVLKPGGTQVVARARAGGVP
jgi:hypothetical protein